MGSNGLRFGFAGIFTAFPAILFGPLYGGITSALTDLLGFFMKPSGDYNFLFTLMGFVGGFLKGLIWLLLKKAGKNTAKVGKSIFAAIMCVFLAFGLSVTISLNKDGLMRGLIAREALIPEKEVMVEQLKTDDVGLPTKFVGMLTSSKGAKSYRSAFATNANLSGLGIAAVGLLGLSVLAVDFIIAASRKKKYEVKNSVVAAGGENPIVSSPSASQGRKADRDIFLKLLISMLISGIIVTTINSKILIELYGIKAPFLVYWLPRLAEEIIVCTLHAYITAIIYKAMEKLFRARGFI
ncbi:MAG: hypothetical protein J6Y21_00835 [Clostridia bacterium]|nr:hypothetical protein [Clostridia bacterium]